MILSPQYAKSTYLGERRKPQQISSFSVPHVHANRTSGLRRLNPTLLCLRLTTLRILRGLCAPDAAFALPDDLAKSAPHSRQGHMPPSR